jgi:7-keto-8-aminopelargonate synthetase-like enzyme
VLGPTGVGAAEAQNVLRRMDLVSLTFSKSLGTCGGAVAGGKRTIDWLKMTARPFLFTASNTPGSLGAATTSLRLLIEHPHWPGEVRGRAEYLRELLVKQGVTVSRPDSAILTVEIGSDAATGHAWRLLWNRGVFCNPVVAPAVKAGHGLLRFSVMRTHTDEDLEDAAAACSAIEEAYASAGR